MRTKRWLKCIWCSFTLLNLQFCQGQCLYCWIDFVSILSLIYGDWYNVNFAYLQKINWKCWKILSILLFMTFYSIYSTDSFFDLAKASENERNSYVGLLKRFIRIFGPHKCFLEPRLRLPSYDPSHQNCQCCILSISLVLPRV